MADTAEILGVNLEPQSQGPENMLFREVARIYKSHPHTDDVYRVFEDGRVFTRDPALVSAEDLAEFPEGHALAFANVTRTVFTIKGRRKPGIKGLLGSRYPEMSRCIEEFDPRGSYSDVEVRAGGLALPLSQFESTKPYRRTFVPKKAPVPFVLQLPQHMMHPDADEVATLYVPGEVEGEPSITNYDLILGSEYVPDKEAYLHKQLRVDALNLRGDTPTSPLGVPEISNLSVIGKEERLAAAGIRDIVDMLRSAEHSSPWL